MSGIFEALEQAQREKGSAKGPQAGSAGSAASLTDQKLAEMNYRVHAYIDREDAVSVAFVASVARAGSSQIAAAFARVSASLIGQSVLILRVTAESAAAAALKGGAGSVNIEDIARDPENAKSVLPKLDDMELYAMDVPWQPPSSLGMLQQHDDTLEPFIDKLRGSFDVIVIDAPPVDLSPVGIVSAASADGAIFVAECERTRWQSAKAVRAKIVDQGGQVLGVVLNKRKFYIPGFIYNRL